MHLSIIMEDTDEVLNLSLSLVSQRKSVTNYEGKILRVLEMREEMVRVLKRKGVDGLELIHLLLITATAVDEKKVSLAAEKLGDLYQLVSLRGDSVQRVAAYFADGLAGRLLTRTSPFYDMVMKPPTAEEELLAFTHLYRASPLYQFAHFTANQAILEAFEAAGGGALHVLDLDISYGFQWPSLIQSLSDKATPARRISLRITGFGRTLHELHHTHTRLLAFAKGLHNVSFQFQGLLKGAPFRTATNETVAVNLVLHLTSNLNMISDTLSSVHSLRPSIVVLVEQEGSPNPRSFISRFMEHLHYFAAMFDSLDDCLPSDSPERLSIEKSHLGKQIKSVLNCDHTNALETWKGRMEGHGFEGIRLSSKCMMQAKLLLKIRSHDCPCPVEGGNGFRVFERDQGKAICLGWQDRCLITASAWRCVLP